MKLWQPLRPLGPLLRPYRRRLIVGLLTVVGTAWIGLAAPLVIGAAIDTLRSGITMRALLAYGALLVAITLVKGVFQYAQRLILITASRDIERDLRGRYFAHLARLELGFFQHQRTGDLMARATNDLEAVRQVCGPAIMYAANTVLTGLGALALMFAIDVQMTLIVLVTLPLAAVVTRVVGQRTHVLFGTVQESFSELSSRVQENISGARVVRAYAREAVERQAFAGASREYVARNRRLIGWSAAFSPLLELVIGLGFALVIWRGGLLMIDGRLTIGGFVSFQLFLSRLSWPMIAVGWVTNLVTRGTASLERIQRILDTEPTIRDPEPTAAVAAPMAITGAISFRDLGFCYVPERPALAAIDLEIAAGETIAIVGRTGAGKSTLLALVPRLLDPPARRLLIDGRDVRAIPLARLRGAIAMVPQETFLFSTSIRNNIAFGRPDADDEKVREAVRIAGLENDLEGFPRGLDTVVGERGITLSGGQKQRVALARAVLREPRILLLDDSLSAVDTQTEEAILRNLRSVLPGRTVLFGSHRMAAARLADRIVVLRDGRLAEVGSHDDLLAAGGAYADLYRRQQLEDALAAAS